VTGNSREKVQRQDEISLAGRVEQAKVGFGFVGNMFILKSERDISSNLTINQEAVLSASLCGTVSQA
jgi:hypothetical protein